MGDFGEPLDVAGQCNAWLHIADNFGDNHATMRCQLPPGHEGEHTEEWTAMPEGNTRRVAWTGNDKKNEEELDGQEEAD
jgi:hypothetical protein